LLFEEDSAQALDGNLLTGACLADGVVLAKHTAQVAAAEEDRARAPVAGQARFLPLVKGHQGDPRIPASAAKARLARQTVDAATSRAQAAAIQQ
jgi:hypothetical protein